MTYEFGKSKGMVDFSGFVSQYNDLTRLILQFCSAGAEGKNVVVSPLSVLILLAIAADSTAGETREEVLSFLGLPEVGQLLFQLQKDLSADHSLSVANAVCIRKDIAPAIHESYGEMMHNRYDAEMFVSDDLVKDVNAWVNKKTNGLISEMLPESAGYALLCLANAVAFESAWADPYEDTDVRDRFFINEDGSKSRVMMLFGSEYGYIENDDFVGFTKPYKNSNLSFMALLPKNEGMKALTTALSRIDFSDLWCSQTHNLVFTSMPEFRFEFDRQLNAFCQASGMEELFTDNADFSPMSCDPLKVEQILHRAYINVNQAGTRAAAATVGLVAPGCAMPRDFKEVHLDRPFVFAIVDREKGIPVFAGVVRHLEDAKEDPERLKRKLARNRKLWAE